VSAAILLLLLLATAPDTTPITCDKCGEWNAPRDAFRVHGNTFYVGPAGLSSVAITTKAGLILLDGALPQSVPLIAAHLRSLGHGLDEVKWILVSHPHFDHAGGVAALARLSGARVATSPANAAVLRAGRPGADDPQVGFGDGMRLPPVATVVELRDGGIITLGDVTVTALHTPGHAPGSTSYTWKSCHGRRCLNVVYADSLNAVAAPGFRFADHPALVQQLRGSIARVHDLPCDVLLSAHPDMSRLFERAAAATLIDPAACRRYAEDAARGLDERLAEERAGARAARPARVP